MARIIFMPIPGYLLYCGIDYFFAVLVTAGILGLTDWLDGIMARKEGPSVLGGLLDPVADKIFIAVIYLPLTEAGIIPVWMTVTIFVRDFLLTSLRTTLLLMDAPMRTSMLAKFKTGIQMIGIGYVILFQINLESPLLYILIFFPSIFPIALILYRLATGQKQGLRSISIVLLVTLVALIRYLFDTEDTVMIHLSIIMGLTILSGLSYLVDAWSAFKGKSRFHKELTRFLLEGLLLPTGFICLLGRFDTPGMSLAIILIVTMELAVGGLGNLLASTKIVPRFRLIAFKTLLQIALAGIALYASFVGFATDFPIGPTCIGVGLLVTLLYTCFSFWKHRTVYLYAI